jgi:hypothetical protein
VESIEMTEAKDWDAFVNRYEKFSEEKVMIAVLQSVSKTQFTIKSTDRSLFTFKLKMIL